MDVKVLACPACSGSFGLHHGLGAEREIAHFNSSRMFIS